MTWVLKCGPPGLRVVWICVQYYILSVDSSPRACRAPARVGRIRRLMRMHTPSGAARCAQEADAVVERDAGLTQRCERQIPPRAAAAEPGPPRVRAAAHQRRETTPFVVRVMMHILVSRVVCPTSSHCCSRRSSRARWRLYCPLPSSCSPATMVLPGSLESNYGCTAVALHL